jgi:hypothetical protein
MACDELVGCGPNGLGKSIAQRAADGRRRPQLVGIFRRPGRIDEAQPPDPSTDSARPPCTPPVRRAPPNRPRGTVFLPRSKKERAGTPGTRWGAGGGVCRIFLRAATGVKDGPISSWTGACAPVSRQFHLLRDTVRRVGHHHPYEHVSLHHDGCAVPRLKRHDDR